MASHHPSIWKFIEYLQRLQQNVEEIKYEQYQSGINNIRNTKKYKDSAGRIQKLVNGYDENDKLIF